LTQREEVHILAIFAELAEAESMQALIYANLPGQNQPEIFGHQVVADSEDGVVCENEHLLSRQRLKFAWPSGPKMVEGS